MKKSNYFILAVLSISVLCVSLFGVIQAIKGTSSVNALTHDASKDPVSSTQVQSNENKNDEPVITVPTKSLKVDLASTLFIGDSRTVGLMDYGKMVEPDFFCNVGMSVYNIFDKSISVPNVGKTTFEELLSSKDYGTIYVMLGLNEMGYEFNSIVKTYKELVTFIKEKEPNSNIIILGNLHVTKSRSDNDPIFNNDNINRLNDSISKFVDNKQVFYLDTNGLFDVDGALDGEKSSDDTHLYGKYYDKWGDWIVKQTETLKEE